MNNNEDNHCWRQDWSGDYYSELIVTLVEGLRPKGY